MVVCVACVALVETDKQKWSPNLTSYSKQTCVMSGTEMLQMFSINPLSFQMYSVQQQQQQQKKNL